MPYIPLYIIAICLMTLFPPAHAEIYKWVDESGRVHFGDHRIDGKQQQEIEIKKHVSSWKKFTIRIDHDGVDLSAEDLQRIDQDVNNVYRLYDQVFYFDMTKTVPVNIKLFPDKDAYIQYMSKRFKRSYENSRGVFIPSMNQIALWLRDDIEGTFRTIKHETSHAIIHTIAPHTPAWLNEGLGEYVETLEGDDLSLRALPHQENLAVLTRIDQQDSRVPLLYFFQLSRSQWYKRNRSNGARFQYIAWEIVFGLMSEANRRASVGKMVHYAARSQQIPREEIVKEAFLGGSTAMESYLRGLKYGERKTHKLLPRG